VYQLSKVKQVFIIYIYNFSNIRDFFSGNTYVQLCEQPTNGITYFRCLLNTFELPNELKPYLPLFVNILTK